MFNKEEHKKYYEVLSEFWKMFVRDARIISQNPMPKDRAEILEEYSALAKYFRDTPYGMFANGLSATFQNEIYRLILGKDMR